jgi:hypothetical protein
MESRVSVKATGRPSFDKAQDALSEAERAETGQDDNEASEAEPNLSARWSEARPR